MEELLVIIIVGSIENSYSSSTISSGNYYVGSILGFSDHSDAVKNCYALSPSITGYNACRVTYSSGINNFAYSNMLVNGFVRNSTNSSSSNGADVTLSEATTQTHYETIGGWGFDSKGPWTFDYTGMNVGTGTNLPILKSFKTVMQNPQI